MSIDREYFSVTGVISKTGDGFMAVVHTSLFDTAEEAQAALRFLEQAFRRSLNAEPTQVLQ